MKWWIKLNLVYLATGITSPCENSGLSSISLNKYWSRYWSQFKEIKMWTMSLDNEVLRKFLLLIMIIIWRPQNHHSTIRKIQIKISTTSTTNRSHITINETRTEHIQISHHYRSGRVYNSFNWTWGIVITSIFVYFKSGDFNLETVMEYSQQSWPHAKVKVIASLHINILSLIGDLKMFSDALIERLNPCFGSH